MRIVITALSMVMFLTLMQPSYAQDLSDGIHMDVFPLSIKPDEPVTITVSALVEPNSTKTYVLTIVPPEGSLGQKRILLVGDSSGLATASLHYPSDFEGSATSQQGNYSIFVQDGETFSPVTSASFLTIIPVPEAPEPVDWVTAFVIPLTIAGTGALMTFVYSQLSSRREKARTLIQKKTETFLTSSPMIWQIVGYASSLVGELKKPSPKRDTQRCFYSLMLFLQARRTFYEKVASYFMDDMEGEARVGKAEENAMYFLRDELTPTRVDEIRDFIRPGQSFLNFQLRLEKDPKAKTIYDEFTEWLAKHPEGPKVLIQDLEIYADNVDYEINKMFISWYSREEGILNRLDVLRKQINERVNEANKQDGRKDERKYNDADKVPKLKRRFDALDAFRLKADQ